MNCELISVGTELLTGSILNTNVKYLSEKLSEMGLSVRRHTTVGDNPEKLEESLLAALKGAELVILTGGLGPTQDDLTKQTVAQVFSKKMVQHPEIEEALKAWFLKRGMKMTANNLRQADIPEGAVILDNPNGTAPGILIESGQGTDEHKMVFLLPGPPREMKAMFEDSVAGILKDRSQTAVVSNYYHCTGIGESSTEQILMDLVDGQTNPTLATYAKPDQVLVRLTASAPTEEEAEKKLAEYDKIIKSRLGEFIFSFSPDTLLEATAKKLLENNITIATAESCTGGLISASLATIPGISESLKAGIVTYSNEMKEQLLGVSHQSLVEFGAVSEEVCRQMCENARKICHVDLAVSVTGIAGPGGGSKEKPVGLVYTGIAGPKGTRIVRNQFYGSREDIQIRSLNRVLRMILEAFA